MAIGAAQTIAWASTYYLPAILVDPVAEALGASRTALFAAFSWALLVNGLCAPAVGRLIDRHGGRPVLATGAAVIAVGLALLAGADGLVLWYLAWTVLGVGMAMGLYDAAFATLGRLLGPAARPAIVGVTLMAGFASTIGWPLGAWLVAHLGWRAMLGCYAVAQLTVVLPLVLVAVPRVARRAVAELAGRAAGRGGRVFLLLATFFTLRAAISALLSVHILTLLGGMGLTTGQAVFAAALIGPAQVGSRVMEWVLARWLSPLGGAWLGAVLLPAGVAALLGGAPAVAFTVLYGMSNGILTISRGMLPLAVFGPERYATLLGRLAMPGLLAQAAAPTLLAPLVTALPAASIFLLVGFLAIVAALCLAGLRLPPSHA